MNAAAAHVNRSRDGVVTMAIVAAAIIVLAVTAYIYVSGWLGYIDNGDGYYLYAGRRVADGAALYTEVMGTQPPLIYLLAAGLFKLGATLPVIRLASAVIRALQAVLVYIVTRRATKDGVAAALAMLIFSLLPVGLVQDRCFDVNSPLTLIALLALVPLLKVTRGGALASGFIGAIALFTKDLYVPILVAIIAYLVVYRRYLLTPYITGLATGCAVLGVGLWCEGGAEALGDAFFAQSVSPLHAYGIVQALLYVVQYDGLVLVPAAIGAIILVRYCSGGLPTLLVWFAGGSLLVLLATVKDGTNGPILQIAEPSLAILVAVALRPHQRWSLSRGVLASGIFLALGLSSQTPDAFRIATVPNSTHVRQVESLVTAHVRPKSTIVVPPYFALLSGNRLALDAGDTYILADQVAAHDRHALHDIGILDSELADYRLPLVLEDFRLKSIPAFQHALGSHYHLLPPNAGTDAFQIEAWVPDKSTTQS